MLRRTGKGLHNFAEILTTTIVTTDASVETATNLDISEQQSRDVDAGVIIQPFSRENITTVAQPALPKNRQDKLTEQELDDAYFESLKPWLRHMNRNKQEIFQKHGIHSSKPIAIPMSPAVKDEDDNEDDLVDGIKNKPF